MSKSTSRKQKGNRVTFSNPVVPKVVNKHRFNMAEIEKLCCLITDKYSDVLSKVEVLEVNHDETKKKECYICSAYTTDGRLFHNEVLEYLSGVNVWLGCLAGCVDFLRSDKEISPYFRKRLEQVYSENIVKLNTISASKDVPLPSESIKKAKGASSQMTIPLSSDVSYIPSKVGESELEPKVKKSKKSKKSKSSVIAKTNVRWKDYGLPLFTL